ncbi:MAG: single-stranded-DNA-specific exonuclease RecJ [Candidatus Saganbacteria bacterium]|nr:single-stranded-DNA-specific exonuclease RecJ [Candidatus Saganbacteria bacterium]
MSYFNKKWQLAKQDPERQKSFSSHFKVSPMFAQILLNRGITGIEEAEKFLSPKLSYLRDPFEIPHMKEAAARILTARERGEKVAVYGDYDVDGVTATVLLVETLKYLGMDVSYYIPHRYDEGYGLNETAIRKLSAEKVNLIVTVDCGVSNVAEIGLAKSLGMEVVVTDHHNIPPTLPPAFAIVDPKLIKEPHPSKTLAGVGVAFKLAWALFKSAGLKDKEALVNLMDLVALGTVADVVPLTGENRIFVYQGLQLLNQKKRLGIKHLIEVAKISKSIGSHQINFGLAPRLNAAGRLEHASSAAELLLSKDPFESQQIAAELNRINIRRQGIGSDIREEVFALIEQERSRENKVIFLAGKQWHPGVIGIVASRVAEECYRPVVLVGVENGVARGSARSIEGFSVFALLKHAEDLFLDFGGHEGAAGFSIETSKLGELKERLQAAAEKQLSAELLVPVLGVDLELHFTEIASVFIKELGRLESYGEGNPVPVFMSREVILTDLRKVGAKGMHLKFVFSDGEKSMEAIGFGFGILAEVLDLDKTYDIAYNLSLNDYGGYENPQLSMVDIRESGSN